jgi:uncharacterized protein (DUF58 family)
MPNQRNQIYLLIVACLIFGLLTGRVLFFNVAAVFFMLMLIAAIWAQVSIMGIGVGRFTRTRRSQVGQSFSEYFSVTNRAFIPKLWLEVRDFSDLPNHNASHVVPPLNPGKKFEWRTDTTCLVRGEFKLGPVSIGAGDPFGLFNPTRRIDFAERMIVYPQIVPLTAFALPVGALSGGEAQRYITQNVTTNAAGVREYVPGDSINRIHWKSTARRNKLIVKEFELDPQVDVWILTDFSKSSLFEHPSVQRSGQIGFITTPYGNQIPPSTEEYGVVIAASLANFFTEQDRTLGFVSYVPHREVHQPERGGKQLTRILETLAVARSEAEFSLEEVLSLETNSFKRGTTLVIITSGLNLRWLTHAQILSQRGIKPVCVFIEPKSFGGLYSSDDIRAKLQLLKIPTLVVNYGDNLAQVLAQRTI